MCWNARSKRTFFSPLQKSHNHTNIRAESFDLTLIEWLPTGHLQFGLYLWIEHNNVQSITKIFYLCFSPASTLTRTVFIFHLSFKSSSEHLLWHLTQKSWHAERIHGDNLHAVCCVIKVLEWLTGGELVLSYLYWYLLCNSKDGPTDRWMDGRTDGLKDEWMWRWILNGSWMDIFNRWTYGWMNGWTNYPTNGKLIGQDGQM